MQLSDREAIIELMARYAYALDSKDYDAIAACFVDTATADYAGFTEPLAGIEQILPHMRRALDPLSASQHLFTNFIVNIKGDRAELRCDILAQHIRHGEGSETSFLAGGRYRVSVARDNGQWKFTAIHARSIWSMGDRAMLPSVSPHP